MKLFKPKESPALIEYRELLTKERDAKRVIVERAEAALPKLKATRDERSQALEAHVAANARVLTGTSNAPTQAEKDELQRARQLKDELQRARQLASDAFTTCERELQQAKPRITEIERLLNADAEVEQLTAEHAALVTKAGSVDRKVKSAADMIAGIEDEKAGRAARRQAIADANASAQLEHVEAAVTAREKGEPIPETPAPKLPAKGEETDDDLDAQRDAIIRIQAKHADELRSLLAEIGTMRDRLTRARFDAADFALRAALHSAKPAITEYEAARQCNGFRGTDASIHVDQIAVRQRVRELQDTLPTWSPSRASPKEQIAPAETPGQAAA